MNEDGPIWGHVAYGAAGLILAGLVLIGVGSEPSRGLSTHIMAAGTRIELTWDNGSTQVVADVLDVEDAHLVAVRTLGGSACWILVNDRLADAKEPPEPVVCTWSRGQT